MVNSHVVIDGRKLLVMSVEPIGDRVMVTVQTAVRVRKAVSGRNPGPGYFLSNAKTNEWLKHEPITTTLVVSPNDIREGYPTCSSADDSEVVQLMSDHVRPAVRRYLDTGPTAHRVVPTLKIGALETAIRRAGLPIPTDDLLEHLVQTAWRSMTGREEAVPAPAPKNNPLITGRAAPRAAPRSTPRAVTPPEVPAVTVPEVPAVTAPEVPATSTDEEQEPPQNPLSAPSEPPTKGA